MPKLFTVRTLAQQFDRHPHTILRWIEDGLFPHAFKIKDGWYVPEHDVDALIKSRCPQPKGFVTRWKA